MNIFVMFEASNCICNAIFFIIREEMLKQEFSKYFCAKMSFYLFTVFIYLSSGEEGGAGAGGEVRFGIAGFSP